MNDLPPPLPFTGPPSYSHPFFSAISPLCLLSLSISLPPGWVPPLGSLPPLRSSHSSGLHLPLTLVIIPPFTPKGTSPYLHLLILHSAFSHLPLFSLKSVSHSFFSTALYFISSFYSSSHNCLFTHLLVLCFICFSPFLPLFTPPFLLLTLSPGFSACLTHSFALTVSVYIDILYSVCGPQHHKPNSTEAHRSSSSFKPVKVTVINKLNEIESNALIPHNSNVPWFMSSCSRTPWLFPPH